MIDHFAMKRFHPLFFGFFLPATLCPNAWSSKKPIELGPIALFALPSFARPAERLVDAKLTDFAADGTIARVCIELEGAWHQVTGEQVNIVLELDRAYYVWEDIGDSPTEHFSMMAINPAYPRISVATSETTVKEIAKTVGRLVGNLNYIDQPHENVVWLAQQGVLQNEGWPLNRKVSGIQLSATDTIGVLGDAAGSLGLKMIGPPKLAELPNWQTTIGAVPDREFANLRELIAFVLGRIQQGRTWLIQPVPDEREGIPQRTKPIEGLSLMPLRSAAEKSAQE